MSNKLKASSSWNGVLDNLATIGMRRSSQAASYQVGLVKVRLDGA